MAIVTDLRRASTRAVACDGDDKPRCTDPRPRIVEKLDHCGAGLNSLTAVIDELESRLESVLRRTPSGELSGNDPNELSPHSPLADRAEELVDRIAVIVSRIQGITERLEC